MKKLLLILLLFITIKTQAQNVYYQNFNDDTIRVEKSIFYCYVNPAQIFDSYQYNKTIDNIYFRLEYNKYILYLAQTQERYICQSVTGQNVSSHLLYMLGLVRSHQPPSNQQY